MCGALDVDVVVEAGLGVAVGCLGVEKMPLLRCCCGVKGGGGAPIGVDVGVNRGVVP